MEWTERKSRKHSPSISQSKLIKTNYAFPQNLFFDVVFAVVVTFLRLYVFRVGKESTQLCSLSSLLKSGFDSSHVSFTLHLPFDRFHTRSFVVVGTLSLVVSKSVEGFRIQVAYGTSFLDL